MSSLVAGNTGSLFAIASATGVITLDNTLDYETAQSHHLKIEARDLSGSGPFSVTCDLTVHVTDKNEHDPAFASATATTTVSEDSKVGKVVYTQAATDKDFGQKVSYSIESQTPTGYFGVNSNGGVYIVKSLDYETAKSHTVKVKATDNDAH